MSGTATRRTLSGSFPASTIPAKSSPRSSSTPAMQAWSRTMDLILPPADRQAAGAVASATPDVSPVRHRRCIHGPSSLRPRRPRCRRGNSFSHPRRWPAEPVVKPAIAVPEPIASGPSPSPAGPGFPTPAPSPSHCHRQASCQPHSSSREPHRDAEARLSQEMLTSSFIHTHPDSEKSTNSLSAGVPIPRA